MKLLQVYTVFTRALAIVLESENNSYTCINLHFVKVYLIDSWLKSSEL